MADMSIQEAAGIAHQAVRQAQALIRMGEALDVAANLEISTNDLEARHAAATQNLISIAEQVKQAEDGANERLAELHKQRTQEEAEYLANRNAARDQYRADMAALSNQKQELENTIAGLEKTHAEKMANYRKEEDQARDALDKARDALTSFKRGVSELAGS